MKSISGHQHKQGTEYKALGRSMVCLEVLGEVLTGGELPLALAAGHGREVLAKVPGQAGRGEELLLALAAGEPLGGVVSLLVPLQGPWLVEQSPALGLRTSQQPLLTPGLLLAPPQHEVTLQHLEETHHVTLSQLDISCCILQFEFRPIINNLLNGILLVKGIHGTNKTTNSIFHSGHPK